LLGPGYNPPPTGGVSAPDQAGALGEREVTLDMRRALLVALTFVLGLAVPALAYAGNGNGPNDTLHPGKDIHSGKKKVVPPTPAQEAAIQATATATTGTTPPVGTERTWLILDDTAGRYRLATFTLQSVGPHFEVCCRTT
jgi:hypothetical protein